VANCEREGKRTDADFAAERETDRENEHLKGDSNARKWLLQSYCETSHQSVARPRTMVG
jgi:hypothetical protein